MRRKLPLPDLGMSCLPDHFQARTGDKTGYKNSRFGHRLSKFDLDFLGLYMQPAGFLNNIDRCLVHFFSI